MCAVDQAAAKQTFDFQAMVTRKLQSAQQLDYRVYFTIFPSACQLFLNFP